MRASPGQGWRRLDTPRSAAMAPPRDAVPVDPDFALPEFASNPGPWRQAVERQAYHSGAVEQHAAGTRGPARELALFEVVAEGCTRARLVEIASVFRGRLIDASAATMTIEAAGLPDEIDALAELLRDFGIVDMARSGPITLG